MAGVPGAVLVSFQGCGYLTPFLEVVSTVSLIKASCLPRVPYSLGLDADNAAGLTILKMCRGL